MQTRTTRTIVALVIAGALALSPTAVLGFRGDHPSVPPVAGCSVAADAGCTSVARDPAPVNPPVPPAVPPTCQPSGRHC